MIWLAKTGSRNVSLFLAKSFVSKAACSSSQAVFSLPQGSPEVADDAGGLHRRLVCHRSISHCVQQFLSAGK